MNKGFILDGYPRNTNDAKAIFTELKPDYRPATVESGEEVTPPTDEDKIVNKKLAPQYAIIFDAEDAFLKQRATEIPPERIAAEHYKPADMDRRLKEFRVHNANLETESHFVNYFRNIIGAENVLVINGPDSQNEAETLKKMQDKCEQSGKPCCINLITESDNRFLKDLAKKESLAELLKKEEAEEVKAEEELTEEEKQARAELAAQRKALEEEEKVD